MDFNKRNKNDYEDDYDSRLNGGNNQKENKKEERRENRKYNPNRRRAKQYTKSIILSTAWFFIIIIVAAIVLFTLIFHVRDNLNDEIKEIETSEEYIVPEDEENDMEEYNNLEIPDTDGQEDNDEDYEEEYPYGQGRHDENDNLDYILEEIGKIMQERTDELENRHFGNNPESYYEYDEDEMEEIYGILEEYGFSDVADELREKMEEEETEEQEYDESITVYLKYGTTEDTINLIMDSVELYPSVKSAKCTDYNPDDSKRIGGVIDIYVSWDSNVDSLAEYLENLSCVEKIEQGVSAGIMP